MGLTTSAVFIHVRLRNGSSATTARLAQVVDLKRSNRLAARARTKSIRAIIRNCMAHVL